MGIAKGIGETTGSGQDVADGAAFASPKIKREQIGFLVAGALVLLLVICSAMGVIYSSYESRQLFSELQQENKETMRLEEEWGRLLLEQSTWASPARIEQIASSKLQMVVPKPAAMIVVKQ